MSWTDLNKDLSNDAPQKTKLSRFRALAYQVFETNPLGKELYEILEDYVDRPVADPSQDSAWAYFRQGENNIVDLLRNAINYIKTKGGTSDVT